MANAPSHKCTRCGVSVHRLAWGSHPNYCSECYPAALERIKGSTKFKKVHLLESGRIKRPLPPWDEIRPQSDKSMPFKKEKKNDDSTTGGGGGNT